MFAHYNRGMAKGNLGEYVAAISDFDTVIRLKPNYVFAYFYRGMAKGVLGRTLEAKQDLRTAHKLATQADDVELKSSIEEYLRQLK